MTERIEQLAITLPAFVFYELKGNSIKLLGHIFRRAQFGKGCCYESIDGITSVLGMSRNAVNAALKELKQKNLIEVEKSFGGPQRIRMGAARYRHGWDVIEEADQRGKIRYVEKNPIRDEFLENQGGSSSILKKGIMGESDSSQYSQKGITVFSKRDHSILKKGDIRRRREEEEKKKKKEEELLLRKSPPDCRPGYPSQNLPVDSLPAEGAVEPEIIPSLESGSSSVGERAPEMALAVSPATGNGASGISSHPAPSDGVRIEIKKISSKRYKFSPQDMAIAEAWASFAHEEMPTMKISLEQWANEVRLTRQRFDITHEGLNILLKFVKRDDFWRPNALSIMGLSKPGKNGMRKLENILLSFKRKDPQARTEDMLRRIEQEEREARENGFYDPLTKKWYNHDPDEPAPW